MNTLDQNRLSMATEGSLSGKGEVTILITLQPPFCCNTSFLDFLTSNEEALLRSRRVIIEEAELRSVPVPETFLSTYSPRKDTLSLGALLELWEGKDWRRNCSVCDSTVLVFGLDGETLCGGNTWWGLCPHCGRISGTTSSFGPLWKTAREALVRFPVHLHRAKELKEARTRKRELESEINVAIRRNRRALERLEQKINQDQDDLLVHRTLGEELDRLLDERQQLKFRIEDFQAEREEQVNKAELMLKEILRL